MGNQIADSVRLHRKLLGIPIIKSITRRTQSSQNFPLDNSAA